MTQVVAQRPASVMTSSRDAFKYLGLIINIVSGFGQIVVGSNVGSKNGDPVQISYTFVLLLGIYVTFFGLLSLFRERIKWKVSIGYYTVSSMAAMIVEIFLLPRNTLDSNNLQTWVGVGFAGVLLILLAIRPNFGPEANKRIYQAAAGIFAFGVAICVIILGFYIYSILDIRTFMGYGTFPGNVYNTYIEKMSNADITGVKAYNFVIESGTLLMIGGGIICVGALLKNKIGLLSAAIVFLVGIVVMLVGLGQFYTYWQVLDDLFYEDYPTEYLQQLQLKDPGVYSIGVVLTLLEVIAMLLMMYASFSAKPLDKWRSTRDKCIAAAEVATREGSLATAVKYLEAAAMWSSKIDEEDKSIELLTRVKQIKDKAIKMKKQEAAEKAKKEYEKKQKAEVKQKAKEEVKSVEPESAKKVD